MSWIIDIDHITHGASVGTMGPRGYTGKGHELACRFRILDDDGIVYYEGRNNTSDDDNAFGPLDDFGAPNAGCTSIQYLVNGRWETL
jgi:hypothetical protein